MVQLEVVVLDVNEHAPVFSEATYRANVSEGADVGAPVARLDASDADQDKRVVYSLHAASSPASLRKFRVDSATGVVSLAEKIDRYARLFVVIIFFTEFYRVLPSFSSTLLLRTAKRKPNAYRSSVLVIKFQRFSTCPCRLVEG